MTSGGSTPMLRQTTKATAVVLRRSFCLHLDTSPLLLLPPVVVSAMPVEEEAGPKDVVMLLLLLGSSFEASSCLAAESNMF